MASALAPTHHGRSRSRNVLIGIGSSATFAPLIADISHWFTRRRGIAVAVCASRQLHRRRHLAADRAAPDRGRRLAARPDRASASSACSPCCRCCWCCAARLAARQDGDARRIGGRRAAPRSGFSPPCCQALLVLAGVGCCVAMSMPQVHIVAYCGDLGYGVARGAEMLSLMLGFGIVSRIASGFIADRIGGLGDAADRLGAAGRGAAALSAVRRADARSTSSRRCSACSRAASCRCMRSSCANISRRRQAGTLRRPRHHVDDRRHGARRLDVGRDLRPDRLLLAAFANGFLWNLLNIAIVLFLILRQRARARPSMPGTAGAGALPAASA